MLKQNAIAVFGGGCFWCTEAVFKMFKGVVSVMPGYAGGPAQRADHHAKRGGPTYREVSTGTTGHAEVIQIEFDPAVITFEALLTVFFATHDPTSLNKQGADTGIEYRSVVFYTTDAQKNATEQMIKDLNASSTKGKPIVTTLEPLARFYPAEAFHKDYYANNSDKPYCQIVIDPKLKKVREKFAELLKRTA